MRTKPLQQHIQWILDRLFLRARVTFSNRAIQRQGDRYDLQTAAILKRVLQANSNCIDVGANRGLLLSEMVHYAPLGRHLAIEPIPELAHRLAKRFPQAEIFEMAAYSKSGVKSFHIVPEDLAYSGIRRRKREEMMRHTLKIEVLRTAIDAIVPQRRPIDLLKLDIEGAEHHAILGAEETIRRTSPVLVFEAGKKSLKSYDTSLKELHRTLSKTFNYKIQTLDGWLNTGPILPRKEFVKQCENDWMFVATYRT